MTLRWAVVAAGGRGSRYGGLKQYERWRGRTLVDVAIDLFSDWDGVVVALPEAREWPPAITVVGGETRRQSVAAGLAAVPVEAEVVAVHDAARPLASPLLVGTLVEALATADGAVPGTPLHDTVKQVGVAGRIEATLDRQRLRAVQTPQVFRAEVLRRAHAQVSAEVPSPDDAALVEAVGGTVVVIDWPEPNPKVTLPGDLERMH